MNRSMPGLPVHHQLQEFTQTHEAEVTDFWIMTILPGVRWYLSVVLVFISTVVFLPNRH